VKRILKYTVEPPGGASMISMVKLPQGARVLSAGVQSSSGIVIWALTDTTANVRPVNIKVIGTGWPMVEDELDGYDFLSTVVMPDPDKEQGIFPDGLVWHLWVQR